MFNQRGQTPVFRPMPNGPAPKAGARAKPSDKAGEPVRRNGTASHSPTPYDRLKGEADDGVGRAETRIAEAGTAEPERAAETSETPRPAHRPRTARSSKASSKVSSQGSAVADRRGHQRVAVDLIGRFMTPAREEHVCRAVDMSPGGVAIAADHVPPEGARIVAYLDHIGRIEGHVARVIDDGFAMTVKATPRRRDKLAAQLTYLANREALSLPEDRRHERVSLSQTRTALTFVNGTEIAIDIIDTSVSGAAVATEERPDVGTPCFVGAVRGRIVRHIDGGLAIEFAQVQDAELLEAALITERPNV